MTTWLKLIGSGKKPIPDGGWTEEYVGFRTKKPTIRAGDQLFLYAPGASRRRIFALAEAAGNAEPDPKYDRNQPGSTRWKLAVRYLDNRRVADGALINEVETDRDLTRSIAQKSHIRLRRKEIDSAHRLLQGKAKE